MIKSFNNFVNENKKTDYEYYMNQINSDEDWKPITDDIFEMIEQEGWVEELTSDIDEEEYDEIRNDVINRFVYKELELFDDDIEGLMNMDQNTLEFFSGLDMNLKENQEYPYHVLDFINYDEGIVYIIKYNE